MKFYLIDDDPNILNILKLIILERNLGTVCGLSSHAPDALSELKDVNPDIVIVDFLMPEMDGITLISKAMPLLFDTAFVMLSQVSSKDMIASAYESGIEFFIQKPINSVEVEAILSKVVHSLSMKRTVQKMQGIFMEELSPATAAPSPSAPVTVQGYKNTLRTILQKLGIIGDIGCKDIIMVEEYLLEHWEEIDEIPLNELCSKFSGSPKSMEQRMRRTASNGLVNLAHLGLEDYSNEIFIEYSNTLYNFEQVRREMDYIRGKSPKRGNVKIRNFLNALAVYSQNG